MARHEHETRRQLTAAEIELILDSKQILHVYKEMNWYIGCIKFLANFFLFVSIFFDILSVLVQDSPVDKKLLQQSMVSVGVDLMTFTLVNLFQHWAVLLALCILHIIMAASFGLTMNPLSTASLVFHLLFVLTYALFHAIKVFKKWFAYYYLKHMCDTKAD